MHELVWHAGLNSTLMALCKLSVQTHTHTHTHTYCKDVIQGAHTHGERAHMHLLP